MLRRVQIDNFKSLINVEFRPEGLNLLLGRNNSGKTNLCQALCFLSTIAQSPLDEAAATVSTPWLLANAYLKKDAITFGCECELADGADSVLFRYELVIGAAPAPHLGPFAREFAVRSEELSAAGGRFGTGTRLLTNESGAVSLLHEARFAAGRTDCYVETTAPTNATMLYRLYDLQHNRAANEFKSYLASWRYYDLDPCKLRDSASKAPATLMPDGSNLATVLYHLKTMNERKYRDLLSAVRQIEPKMDALNFVPPTSQDSVFMFMADPDNMVFTTQSWSTGTLRYLALAFVLLIEADQPRLIIIEEPENGLYVGQLKELMRLAQPGSSPGAQVLFTSHAPYFVDLFDEHLDGLVLARSVGTHTELVRPDPALLTRLLEEFPLGEAHFRGLIQ